MPSVRYGNRTIEYTIQEKEGLKSHYISVEKKTGVVLKGTPIPAEKADALVLKKARWILDKMELVRTVGDEDIVTGSRIPYLGRKYYVEVIYRQELEQAELEFNQSRFRIYVNPAMEVQPAIKAAVNAWLREKAVEKIAPRVKKLSRQTGLPYQQLKFQQMEKRWGSCTESNNIILNTKAVKLPFTLIDYIIVHELCHTRVKNHSKEFWAELARHIPNWKELDEKVAGMKL
ncbi:M48 family metallopeptidase [Nafulsella turpanensis]|uniref:M48 family metallopeptidase n=1 Tax=Nafulsella turpanensis TaxID=1265690 RepID=UPI000345369D|nr:SprT family zinc-dependent metalloprotease [Nafulsella turpanensis]